MDGYTYDAVGNRETLNATTYTYDDADQMTSAGGVAYGYDLNGNQTSRGATDTFDYEHENRLTQSVIGGVTSSSTYNGDGLRMSHTVSGQTTSYTWDVAAGLPVVLQDGTNTYVYGLDLISATDGSAVQTYFLYDGLGSVTDLTDGSGNSVDGYTYDAFGAIRSQSGSSDNYWLFTGEQQDSDEGLYYLRARYYDPATGRFLTHDPVPSGNLYSYVANNPVNLTDPTGLCWKDLPCPPLPPPPIEIISEAAGLLPSGQIKVPGIGMVSFQTAATCVIYPAECAVVGALSKNANREMFRIYGDDVAEGTRGKPSPGDAFQHCFWSGSITLALGAGRAEMWTTRHEAMTGNLPKERAYDVTNNARGRAFGESLRPNFGPLGSAPNPFALSELRSHCKE